MSGHNIENVLAALGGSGKQKKGTGPVASEILASGSAVEDLGGLVTANEGVPQEVLALAQQAALAADESREAGAKAKALKAELELAMQTAKVAEIALEDRDPITFVTKVVKSKALKALKTKMAEEARASAMVEDKGADTAVAEAEAQAKAKTLWDTFWGLFPRLPSTSLNIPNPREPEPPDIG